METGVNNELQQRMTARLQGTLSHPAAPAQTAAPEQTAAPRQAAPDAGHAKVRSIGGPTKAREDADYLNNLMLVDVLELQAIDSFWGRVEMAQKAIRTEMEENPESGRFLTDDSQWDETVKQDFLRDTVEGNSGSYSSRNYIAQFSSNMKSDSGATTAISGQLRGERYDVKVRGNRR